MRTSLLRLRSLAGWSPLQYTRDVSRSPADQQRAERVLAVARIFFVGSSLAAIAIDPTQPARYSWITYVLLAGYLIGGLAVWMRVLRTDPPSFRLQALTHAGDLVWATLLTAVTEGPNSPFFLFYMFVLLAAASRWGFRETVLTAAVAVVLLGLEAVLMKIAAGAARPLMLGSFDAHRLIMRAVYLLIAGGLLGYLAEEEKQRRAETAIITRIIANIRAEASIWTMFEAMAGEVLELFEGTGLLLLFEDLQNGRTFRWTADVRPDGALRIAASEVAAGDMARYWIEPPGDAWRADLRGGTMPVPPSHIVALERNGRQIDARPLALPPDWIERHPVSSMMGVTVSFADIGSGIVLLFDARLSALPQLRFLQRLANQIAPAMYGVYLLRRLRSRVGALERARIARELHDGVIQTLIGLEMQVDALRRRLGDTSEVVEDLARVQELLAREIHDLRDLTHELEPADFAPRQLLEHLQELVDRFRRETGITARFVSQVEEVTLAPPVCHELARIAQEALVNVRKHSGARNVVVRFTFEAGSPKLIIDNDGRGFDFTGRLSQADLDRTRKGPVVIKERVRALGGQLVIESSDRGVRLEISLPPRALVRHKTA